MASSPLSKLLLPSLVGVLVYITVNKFFPEKNPIPTEFETFKPDPVKDLRGGNELSSNWKLELVKSITQKILKDKALKLAIASVFATAGLRYFSEEIEALLVSELVKTLEEHGTTIVDGQLKVVLDIVQEHDLAEHSKAIRHLIVTNNLTKTQKLQLLKLKLEVVINGECLGNKRFVLMMVLGALFAVTLSGVGGLALMLEALYELFKEGKISEALYHQLRKLLIKKAGGKDVDVPA